MDHPRIWQDPKIMFGKPVIRGTRIPVDLILRKMGWGWSDEMLLAAYPGLSREDLRAAQSFAADYLAGERVITAD